MSYLNWSIFSEISVVPTLIIRIPVERIVGNQTGSVNFFEGDIERLIVLTLDTLVDIVIQGNDANGSFGTPIIGGETDVVGYQGNSQTTVVIGLKNQIQILVRPTQKLHGEWTVVSGFFGRVVQHDQHSKGVIIGGNDAEIITSIGISASTIDASAERSIIQVVFGIAAGDGLHPNGKALVIRAAISFVIIIIHGSNHDRLGLTPVIRSKGKIVPIQGHPGNVVITA